MNKTFVRCWVVVLDGDQLLSCSGEIAPVGRHGGEHHACVEPKAVVSGLVGKPQQRARTRFSGIEPGEIVVLPHLRVQHGGQQAVDVVLRLANLGQHGLGVVVTIQMLKRPDLLGLVRRIRQPAQVGEVVQGEPVPALIPGDLDQRHDSQPLRIGVLESMSFGERDPCHRLGTRRRLRPRCGQRLRRGQLSAQQRADTVSSQGAARASFHLNAVAGDPERSACVQFDAGDGFRLTRNSEQPIRHGQCRRRLAEH